jgi:hypothetical protein
VCRRRRTGNEAKAKWAEVDSKNAGAEYGLTEVRKSQAKGGYGVHDKKVNKKQEEEHVAASKLVAAVGIIKSGETRGGWQEVSAVERRRVMGKGEQGGVVAA